ncbi:MAG: NUDIX domain-containing protein [Chloroflexota bacterium]
MNKQTKETILGQLYAAALQARKLVWRIRKPTLMGVRALVVRQNEVLLIRHRSGTHPWSLPGGGVDRYERMVEAIRREAYEEAGVRIRVERLLGTYDNFQDGVSNYVAVFVCTPFNAPKVPCSLEIADAQFFAFDHLPSGIDHSSHQRIIEYRAGGQGLTDLW